MRTPAIIPVHHDAAFLAQTLRPVLHRDRAPDRVIVVDAGCSDDSAKIDEGFGPAVVPVRGEYGGARVAGVAHATGDALMSMDAGDLRGLGVVEALPDTLTAHPGAIACCDWLRHERIGATWQARPASCAPRRPGQGALAAWPTGWDQPPCSALWSRAACEVCEACGGWNREMLINKDGDLTMRALAGGTDLVHSRRGTSCCRRLPDVAVSLSGRRFTPPGLASRLSVLYALPDMPKPKGFPSGTRAARQDRRHGGTPARALRRKAADRRRQAARAATSTTPTATEDAPAVTRGRPPTTPHAPRVSVGIPVFSRAALLHRAIASVLAQDFEEFELLIIDDASTNGLLRVGDGFADPRPHMIRRTRNHGIDRACAPLIVFLDSGDERLPGNRAAQVAAMDAAPMSVGLCCTGLIETGSEGTDTVFEPSALPDFWAEILHRNIVHYNTSSLMIRRNVIETTGGFDESLATIEDWDLLIHRLRPRLPAPAAAADDLPRHRGRRARGRRQSRPQLRGQHERPPDADRPLRRRDGARGRPPPVPPLRRTQLRAEARGPAHLPRRPGAGDRRLGRDLAGHGDV
ncbi:glycosyltransferase family A protein [Palleronia rufa]|uniref:glycosyltransferase family A protein n=1 Tax=Palleronia rufa TaxID=1530186 RepID=UPI000562150E|nr:glycosyltransferase family A protein [Palleronia rufa]